MRRSYEEYNAEAVLGRLENYIERGCSRPMHQVCDDLSIFDWWPERLSITHMKQMRSFLKEAIKLGYTGYVCFKVGASGCANGMWAHKEPTTTGYSPDCDAIYRSFTPDYTYYAVCINKKWLPEDKEYDSLKNPRMLEQFITNYQKAN